MFVVVTEEFRYLCSFVNRFGVSLCLEDCKDLAEWLRGMRPEEYRGRVAGESEAGSCLSSIPSSQSPQLSKGRRSSKCGSSKAGGRWCRWRRRWGWTTSSRKDDAGSLEKDVLSAPPPISVTNIYFQQASAMSLARATTMELNRTEERRICIIGPLPSEKGGVSRSTLIITYIFRKILGYNTILLPDSLLDSLRDNRVLKLFRSCNVIHLQYPTIYLSLLLFTIAKRPKIMLTLRGWVIKEMLIYFRSNKKTFRRFFGLVYIMVLWNLYRYLLSKSIIDYITSVSKITARENGIRNAIIVPNATLCKPLDPCKDYSRGHNHDFRIVTYVSIGGGKIESIPIAVTIVNYLNKLLKQDNLQISAILEIYGKEVPDNIIQTISRLPFVKYMGYVSDFKNRVKGADLFLIAYTFPELGHASIEAVCSGVTLAKLTADPTEEEIVDGFNGILATSPHELVMKIYNYLLKRDEQRCYIAKNAISTILRKRDPQLISLYWRYLLESLLGH